MATIRTSADSLALDRFSDRKETASTMRTKEWSNPDLKPLRNAAFFSAGVNNAKFLQAAKERILEGLDEARRDPAKAMMSRDKFVSEMKDWAASNGYALGGTSIKNATSNRRLSLIYQMNVDEAREYARYVRGQNPDALDEFPAQRLVRLENRKMPRDWAERWEKALEDVGDDKAAAAYSKTGIMVALKTSPVWSAISRFDRPYPPFDFGSGMGVRNVPREDAVKYGLLEELDDVPPIGTKEEIVKRESDISELPSDIQERLMNDLDNRAIHVEMERGKLTLKTNKQRERATWSDYGYQSAKEWKDSMPAQPQNNYLEAAKRLESEIDVEVPQIGKAKFGTGIFGHWVDEKTSDDNNKPQKELIYRLSNLDTAIEAIKDPIEIWQDTNATGKQYTILNITETSKGKKGIMYVCDENGIGRTYFFSDKKSLNGGRHGKLIYKKNGGAG